MDPAHFVPGMRSLRRARPSQQATSVGRSLAKASAASRAQRSVAAGDDPAAFYPQTVPDAGAASVAGSLGLKAAQVLPSAPEHEKDEHAMPQAAPAQPGPKGVGAIGAARESVAGGIRGMASVAEGDEDGPAATEGAAEHGFAKDADVTAAAEDDGEEYEDEEYMDEVGEGNGSRSSMSQAPSQDALHPSSHAHAAPGRPAPPHSVLEPANGLILKTHVDVSIACVQGASTPPARPHRPLDALQRLLELAVTAARRERECVKDARHLVRTYAAGEVDDPLLAHHADEDEDDADDRSAASDDAFEDRMTRIVPRAAVDAAPGTNAAVVAATQAVSSSVSLLQVRLVVAGAPALPPTPPSLAPAGGGQRERAPRKAPLDPQHCA